MVVQESELNLGELLRMHRRLKNLSQAELGDKIGVTPTTIMRWERKGHIPRFDCAVKLMIALEIPYEYLRRCVCKDI
jgi:transcriptional regulator with XRE-family HTH domain